MLSRISEFRSPTTAALASGCRRLGPQSQAAKLAASHPVKTARSRSSRFKPLIGCRWKRSSAKQPCPTDLIQLLLLLLLLAAAAAAAAA